MFRKISAIRIFVYLLVCLFAYLLICLLPQASAQDANAPFDLTISPHFFDLSALPGSITKKEFRVRNNSSSPIDLKIQIKNLSSDDTGKALLLDPAANDDAIKYIQLPVASFSAKPKEWATIPFSISLPKNTTYGYDWALVVTGKNTANTQGTTAKLNGAVAIPILLDINKEGAVIDGRVIEFKTDAPWYEYLPANFITTFANTGNLHIKPKGNIFISDWLGNPTGFLEINQDSGAILPHTRRQFTSTWDNSFITLEDKVVDGNPVLDRQGRKVKTLKFRFDKVLDLRIGKYTARAFVVLSGPKKDYSYEAATSFIVFPWKIILGATVVLLLVAIGLFSTVKSIWKTIVKLLKKKKNTDKNF